MSAEVEIANGFAKVCAGEWIAGAGQPVATFGRFAVKGMRGLVVPDRASVRRVSVTADGGRKPAVGDNGRTGDGTGEFVYFSSADRPFLVRLDALPDETLSLVSATLLVAPAAARTGACSVRPIPMSFRNAFAVTEFRSGWAVAATKSRVERISVEEGRSFSVNPTALVAWVGKRPTGFCPKLGLLDLLLPRSPRGFALDFHGPAVVWIEGVHKIEKFRPLRPV